jgi:hypothetical protein
MFGQGAAYRFSTGIGIVEEISGRFLNETQSLLICCWCGSANRQGAAAQPASCPNNRANISGFMCGKLAKLMARGDEKNLRRSALNGKVA